MPNLKRALAILLFDNPEDFLQFGVSFETAKETLLNSAKTCSDTAFKIACPAQSLHELINFLSPLNCWVELFESLFSNQLLSVSAENFNVTEFSELWKIVKGFDVDGLILIGSKNVGADFRQNSRLARYHIGATASDFFEDPSLTVDNHIHFGQFVDFNLIWATFMTSTREPLYTPPKLENTSSVKSFRETLRYMQANKWDDRFQTARYLLLAYNSNAEVKEEMYRDVTICIHDGYGKDHINKFKTPFDNAGRNLPADANSVIKLEKAMFLNATGNEDDLSVKIALTYFILKNAFFNRALSNSINQFESFSLSLDCLRQVFSNGARLMTSSSALNIFKSNIDYSKTIISDFRYQVKLSGSGPKTSLTAEPLKGLKIMRENISKAPICIALNRSCFESLRYTPDTLICKIVEYVEALRRSDAYKGIQIAGVDLIGSEVRPKLISALEGSGGASHNLLITPIDFVFSLRDELEKNTPNKLFSSFHSGEHFVKTDLGLLCMLRLLLDPRFRVGFDRISHGLILKETTMNMSGSNLNHTKDSIISANLRILRKISSEVFIGKEKADLESDLQLMLEGQSKEKRKNILSKLRQTIANKVSNGTILIEVCPMSNNMIRSDLVGCTTQHPWKKEYADNKLLIGTDDPSLTQTLPWMEHAFMRATPL